MNGIKKILGVIGAFSIVATSSTAWGAACDYLLITSTNLQSAFQPLATHRTSFKGLTSQVLTTTYIYANYTGIDNQTKIRNCIKDYVATKGTTYVCLGGDNTAVPVRKCKVIAGSYSASVATDLYYAGLSGTWDEDGDKIYGEADTAAGDEGDLLVDVWVGRIPVQTAAQATAYINKLKAYETNPPVAISRKFITGGHKLWNTYTGTSRPTDLLNDGHRQFTDVNHPNVSDSEIWLRRQYRDVIQSTGYVPSKMSCGFDTITSWDVTKSGDYLNSGTNIAKRLSEGYNMAIWVAHGKVGSFAAESSDSFGVDNANGMTGLTPIFYTGSCHTGRFDNEPSLSEAMLRNPNGGSLAYFGCAHYNWGGTFLSFQTKFLQVVFKDKVKNLAKAFYDHKAAFISSAGYNNTVRWDTFCINYQGDPAITIVGTD